MSAPASHLRQPLVLGNPAYAQITNDVLKPMETLPSKLWWASYCCQPMATRPMASHEAVTARW